MTRTEREHNGRGLRHGDHRCLLYETAAEQRAVLIPFVSEGLARNECCIYLADDRKLAEAAGALAEAGVNVPREQERGALLLGAGRDTSLCAGLFDPVVLTDFLQRHLTQARVAGFSGVRVTGEMTWVLGAEAGCDRLREYETLLNQFCAGNPVRGLCQYHRSCFPPERIDQALRTHPVVMLGGQAYPNCFYEPPPMLPGQTSAAEQVEEKVGHLKWARATEQAIRESDALLRAVVEGSSDALFVKDRQGRYRLINSAGAGFLGKSVEEVLGKDDTAFFAPETARLLMEDDLRILAAGDTHTYERVTTAAGVTRTYLTTLRPYRDLEGNVLGVIGTARDVTASKTLQRERDQLLERLRLQIKRLPLAYILLDEDVRVLEWNPAAEKLFGYTREEAVGRLCLDLILPLPLNGQVQEIVRRIRAGDMNAHSVNENRTRDGRVITCEWFNTPLLDAAGRCVGIFALAQDVTERERAEAALARDALLLANVRDSVMVTDLDGVVTYWNEGSTRLFGWTAQEMLGRPMTDRVPEEGRAAMAATIAAIRAGEEFSGEWLDYRKDGSRVWIDARVTRLLDGTGRPVGLMGLAHDVSDRKQVEQALRESEEQVRLLLDSAGEAIYGIDLEGRCTLCNAACLRLLGYADARDLLGRNMHQLIHHTWADGTPYPLEECRIVRAYRQGVGTHAEDEVLWRADGTSFPVEYWSYPVRRGEQVVGAVVTFVDISERRRVEEELRTLNAALENAVEGIARLDTQGRYLSANPAYAGMVGYSPEEMVGSSWQPTVHPDDLDKVKAAYRRMLSQGRAEVELLGVRKDHSVFWKQVVMVKTHDQQGQWTGHYCFMKDISKRKEAEQALEQYATRLQALSRRLVEVQEEERRHLARELHDELGQILTSLKFALEAGASALPETAGAMLGEARSLIGEALTRVRELSFDLRPALLDLLGLLPSLHALIERYTARTGVRVNFKHAGLERRFAPEVETTVYRIVQEALTNVARHAQVKEAVVRLWVESEVLEVQVEDQGVGFDHQAALAAGHSNGLTGMRERVKLLGGSLLIDSTPGSGTHLLAELPFAGQPGGKVAEHCQRPGR